MAADVDGRGSDFKIGAVRPLFQTQARFASGHSYDVSADGQRFLVNALLDMGGQAGPNAAGRAPITLVVNWRALLPQ